MPRHAGFASDECIDLIVRFGDRGADARFVNRAGSAHSLRSLRRPWQRLFRRRHVRPTLDHHKYAARVIDENAILVDTTFESRVCDRAGTPHRRRLHLAALP